MQSRLWLKWFSLGVLAIVFGGAGWYIQRAQAQPTGGGGFGGGIGFSSAPTLYTSAITARGGYLYVVHGNTLYKYTEKEMNLVKRVELSPPPVAPLSPGGGGF